MEFWQAVVLGVIEGATEFIPVSSTGHLIIANAILGIEGEAAAVFDVCIQGGAILAVLIQFRDRFLALLKCNPLQQRHYAMAAAIIPFLVFGALFGGAVKRNLFSVDVVAYALIVGGVMLVVVARRFQRTQASGALPPSEPSDSPSVRQALIVGLCQLGALWPGMSRSACTIAGGLLAGLPLKSSAEFSFIIAVPILLAASAKDGLTAIGTFTAAQLGTLSVGFVVSFLVAFLSLKVFLKLLSQIGLEPFGWYRIAVGAAILYLM